MERREFIQVALAVAVGAAITTAPAEDTRSGEQILADLSMGDRVWLRFGQMSQAELFEVCAVEDWKDRAYRVVKFESVERKQGWEATTAFGQQAMVSRLRARAELTIGVNVVKRGAA